jgi:hypothetical protein
MPLMGSPGVMGSPAGFTRRVRRSVFGTHLPLAASSPVFASNIVFAASMSIGSGKQENRIWYGRLRRSTILGTTRTRRGIPIQLN